MLLAIDIGNSAIKLGIFDKEELISKFLISTVKTQNSEEIYKLIKEKINSEISGVIISSVVFELEFPFRELFEKYYDQTPIFIDYTFDFGFKIKYFPPGSCGSDRLLNAFAAVRKYGNPCIVCSFGTATTIDVVNSKNEFLGGIIAPGMKTLADSLFEKTSKLPKVEIVKPEKVIGDSTVGSIQSGIYFGYISLVDGIIYKMIKELNENPKIIATGGFSGLIAESSKFIEIVDENLMLEGLQMIYRKMK
jgi:type III pantothenate kinase